MTIFPYIALSVIFALGSLHAQQIIIEPSPGNSPKKAAIQRSPDQVQMDRARREEQRGNYEGALAAWQEVLRIAPVHQQAIAAIPNCYTKLRKFDEAEAFLQNQMTKAQSRGNMTEWMDPTSVFSLTLVLGEIKLARDESEAAWKIWKDALADQPHNPDALRALINVLHRNHRWEESERLIRDYRKEEKVPSYMALELASSLQAQMNYAGATDELLLYTKTSPTAWQISQNYLSRFPDDSTVEQTVMSALDQAVKRDRKDATIWRLYAGFTMKSGHLSKALDATITADSLSEGGGMSVLTMAQQLLQEHEVDLAKRGFEKVLAWKPAQQFAERAELGLAQCLEAQGKYDEAKASYERFVAGRQSSPDIEEARFHVAEIMLEHENRPADALTEYTGIYSRAKPPLKQRAGMRIGDAHAYMGEYGQAIEAWTRTSRTQGGNISDEVAQMLLRIARANIWRDSTTIAEAVLDSIMKGSTQNTTFNDAVLYQALLSGGGFHGALRSFADADYAAFRQNWVVAAEKYGEAASGLKYGRLAEWSRLQEAEALRSAGKPIEAIAALDTFVVTFAESVDLPRAKYLIAVITLDDLHQEDQALKLLQDYLVDYPRSLYLEQARRKARVLANKIS